MSLSTLSKCCLRQTSSRLFSSFASNGTHSLRPKLLEQVKSWAKLPVNHGKLIRSLRLSGLGLSLSAAPLLRIAEAKSRRNASNETLSKRADHIHGELTAEDEPTLSMYDLWMLMKPYWGYFLAAVLSAVATAIVNIQLPIYLGELIDVMVELIKETARDNSVEFEFLRIKRQAMKLLACYASQACLTFLYITFLSVLGERMAADLRVKLFDRLVVMDLSFYDAQKTGELTSRLNVDVHEFKSSFKQTVAQGMKTITQTAGCIVSLARISPRMTMLTIAVLPLIITVGAICGALLRTLSRSAQAQSAVASSVADEAFGNIRTVRAFAMEQQESSIYNREVRQACALNERLGMGIGLFQGATNFFLNGIVLSVLYGGAGLINTGELSPGELMSFLVTAQTIQRSLSQLSLVFGHALKGYTAGARVFQFVNMYPSIRMDDGICIPYQTLWGEIKFEDVDFNYPTRPGHKVFDKLNLTIPAGQIVALCGPSGEGKSTITSLLERFYEPLSGRITLDGKDLRNLNLEWLRGQVIGLISQEPVLFATTIAENIRYGRPGATDNEVRDAARLANADDFINGFPSGYETVVGERGTQLSGGQKQRIAIARALLKNPPILILDEATSALDTDSERLVREALDRAMKGRTVLVIAHRLSTIQNANLICVVKDKKVVEQGTHKELLKQKGVYYNLVQSQYTDV